MKRSIAGSRILITGASGGLGRALALEMARHRASLVLLARREEKLREVANEVGELGGASRIVVGDITDPASRKLALDAAKEEFGGLDLLVNNAGVGAISYFTEADPDRLRRIFEINFFAPVELIREALPLLQAGRKAMVVNVGSILAHRAMPRYNDYCASKFAMRGWSESVRPELAKIGIDLLEVDPGPTATEFWSHLLEKQGDVPWTQGYAIPASRVAALIVQAIEEGRRTLIPGFRAKWFVRLNRWFPRVVDFFVRRYA